MIDIIVIGYHWTELNSPFCISKIYQIFTTTTATTTIITTTTNNSSGRRAEQQINYNTSSSSRWNPTCL